MKQKLLHFSFLILSFGLIMTACGVVDSTQDTKETMLPTTTQVDRNDDYWIRINKVQVQESDLITFSGSTNIP